MEEKKQKTFLEELQALDESVKRKILTVTTVVVMVVVAYAWVGYFNGLVAGTSEQATVATTVSPQGSSGGGFSFWQNIKNGMADMANTLRGPGQYTVKPE